MKIDFIFLDSNTRNKEFSQNSRHDRSIDVFILLNGSRSTVRNPVEDTKM